MTLSGCYFGMLAGHVSILPWVTPDFLTVVSFFFYLYLKIFHQIELLHSLALKIPDPRIPNPDPRRFYSDPRTNQPIPAGFTPIPAVWPS
jgi:hypothetical protein